MGALLGLGMTHWPALTAPDEYFTRTFNLTLTAPAVPAAIKDPKAWPPELVAELGDDGGLTAAHAYGARLAENFRTMRRILDDFSPDVVVIFGDDQYENFKEDIVPPFCVYGFDDVVEIRPWDAKDGPRPNRWGEPADWAFDFHGHRDAAKYLTRGLIERGVDMPYAYKPLHKQGLSHAFLNTLLFLDWDRRGFPYRVVPVAVNCYGSQVLQAQGGLAALFSPPQAGTEPPDPPGPSPWRCMDVGACVAEVFRDSPWRVALIASASWSHAFLSPKHGFLISDIESDRRLFEALRGGEYGVWRQQTTEEIELAGQHEMLNWMLLAGAMEQLGRKPQVHDYMESHLFTSQKCFVSFPQPEAFGVKAG